MNAWRMPHVEHSEIPTQAGADGKKVESLKKNGFTSLHWSAVGNPSASDYEILEWARQNRYIVFTHDLDDSYLQVQPALSRCCITPDPTFLH